MKPRLLQACAALGFLISIAGPVTYPKPRALPDVVRACALDALLIETDAPYLAPGKYRGKRNEPSYVTETAKVLAATRGVSVGVVAGAVETVSGAARIRRGRGVCRRHDFQTAAARGRRERQ